MLGHLRTKTRWETSVHFKILLSYPQNQSVHKYKTKHKCTQTSNTNFHGVSSTNTALVKKKKKKNQARTWWYHQLFHLIYQYQIKGKYNKQTNNPPPPPPPKKKKKRQGQKQYFYYFIFYIIQMYNGKYQCHTARNCTHHLPTII